MTVPISRTTLFADALPLVIADRGSGRPFLLLHGGAGPASVLGLADALATEARVIVPTHPGFNGEPRPDWFRRVDDLALAYLGLLDRLDLHDVVVVGNSLGGWIGAEMALRHSPRIAATVLINAVGIDTGSPDKAIVDPLTLAPAERASFAFHDPARFAAAPPTPEAAAMMVANQKTLRVYAGEILHDPGLRPRLAQFDGPALVLWGASDRIVDADYGRLFAASIPGACFELVPEAGHFPHIERRDEVLLLMRRFLAATR